MAASAPRRAAPRRRTGPAECRSARSRAARRREDQRCRSATATAAAGSSTRRRTGPPCHAAPRAGALSAGDSAAASPSACSRRSLDRSRSRPGPESSSATCARFIAESAANVDAGRGLWFHGDVGTGKTTLAMLVSRRRRDAGHSVAIYSVPLLLAEIKRHLRRDRRDSYMQLFRRLSEVDCSTSTTSAPSARPNGCSSSSTRSSTSAGRTTARSSSRATSTSLDGLREQVGPRTVSRLVRDLRRPVPMMGADLRMRHGA